MTHKVELIQGVCVCLYSKNSLISLANCFDEETLINSTKNYAYPSIEFLCNLILNNEDNFFYNNAIKRDKIDFVSFLR